MADFNEIKERYDSLVDSSDLSELSEKIESISKLMGGELQQRLDAIVDGGFKFIKTERAQLEEISQLWRENAPQVESLMRNDAPELEQQVQKLRKRVETVLKQAEAQNSDESEEDDDEKPSSSRRLSMSREEDDDDEKKPSSSRRLSMSRDDDDDEDEDKKSSSSRRLSMSRENDDEDEKPASSRRLSMSSEKDEEKPSRTNAELAQLEGLIENLQEKSDDVSKKLSDVEREISSQISALTSRLSRIEWILEQVEESGFELKPTESIYLADKAEWIEEHKRDGPDGFIYLTTERVIFEQREKVGKRLGMFGGKKVQDVLWEFPVTAVDDLRIEDKGMFGGKDIVHFRLNDQARYADLSVVVKGSGDNKEWAKAIDAVKSGNFD